MANPRFGEVSDQLPLAFDGFDGYSEDEQRILGWLLPREVALHSLILECAKRMKLDPEQSWSELGDDEEDEFRVYPELRQKYQPQLLYAPEIESLRFPGPIMFVDVEHTTRGWVDLESGHGRYIFDSTVTVQTNRDLRNASKGRGPAEQPVYPRPTLSATIGSKAVVWRFADKGEMDRLLADHKAGVAAGEAFGTETQIRNELATLLEYFKRSIPLPASRK